MWFFSFPGEFTTSAVQGKVYENITLKTMKIINEISLTLSTYFMTHFRYHGLRERGERPNLMTHAPKTRYTI